MHVRLPQRRTFAILTTLLQFLDLSAHVHSIMLERFTELAKPPPYDDPTEKLPMPSVSALDWKADALVNLDDTETETDDLDWDDVAILIGSEIVRDIRAAIRNTLKFTCVRNSHNFPHFTGRPSRLLHCCSQSY